MPVAIRVLAVAALLALTGCPDPGRPPPVHGDTQGGDSLPVPPPPPPPVHGN